MRRAALLVLTALTVASCGGESADREGFARRQDDVDRAAQVISLVVAEAVAGTPPTGEILATGSVTGCKGSPGGVFYHLDTVVTHRPIDADQAADRIVDALRAEGIDARPDDADVIRIDLDGIEADVGDTGQGDPPTGQSIFVGTPCIDVGETLAAELTAQPGRPVRR